MKSTTIITFDIKFSNVDFAKNCGMTLMIHQLFLIVYDLNTVTVKPVEKGTFTNRKVILTISDIFLI